ncbi:Uu.00g073140.m01.CDS01 [Anthostomella pinea]|uniref:Uu.00g073140.m01.CDS01 n=1 Tax=Anthostomella pinea TaxID=933095 RepID=A0AAI8YNT3_9PEZI|nr:Uu.00g073140.m01.CDS01 [Anthostomella pinea]
MSTLENAPAQQEQLKRSSRKKTPKALTLQTDGVVTSIHTFIQDATPEIAVKPQDNVSDATNAEDSAGSNSDERADASEASWWSPSEARPVGAASSGFRGVLSKDLWETTSLYDWSGVLISGLK